MNWYYMDGDKQQGPVGDDVIKILVLSGKLGIGSLVRTEGMSDWWTADQAMLERIAGTRQHEDEAGPRRSWKADDSSVRDWEESGGSRPSLARLRIGAACVDLALIFLFGALFSRVIATEWFGGTDHEYPWHFMWVPGWAAFSLLWLGFCMAKGAGVSPGQLLLGVGVARGSGKAIGLPLLGVRWLASWGAAYVGIRLLCVNVGGLIFGDADNYSTCRFGVVAAMLLVLAAPLFITRGRRSVQDLLSGCSASARFPAALPAWRTAAAGALVVAALTAQGYDIWKGYVCGLYDSPEGGFSVWFPGKPEIEKAEGAFSANVSAARVLFSVSCSDLQKDECYDLDKAVDSTIEGGGQIYWSQDLGRNGSVGRRWRLTRPIDGIPGGVGEEHVVWVTGERVYWLTVRGSCRQMDKIGGTADRLFTQSFRFRAGSPARLARSAPEPHEKYNPYPFAAAMFGMASPWQKQSLPPPKSDPPVPVTQQAAPVPTPVPTPQPYSDPF